MTVISTAGIVQSETILAAVIRLIIREHPGSRGGQLPRLLIPPSEAPLKLTGVGATVVYSGLVTPKARARQFSFNIKYGLWWPRPDNGAITVCYH